MIAINKIVSRIVYNKKFVAIIYYGQIIYQAIKSCFGKGYWINDKPWQNSDAWKN